MTTEQEQAEELRGQADDAYNDHDWNQALTAYQKALAIKDGLDEAGTSDAKWYMAICYAKLGDPDTARQVFQQGGWSEDAYSQYLGQPDESGDQFDLALDAYQLGNFPYAIELLEPMRKTVKEDQKLREVHWNLAMAYYHVGREDDAMAEFKEGRWTEADYGAILQGMTAPERPDTGDGSQHLELGIEAMNADNWDMALGLFQEALAGGASGDVAKQAHWNAGVCCYHLGDQSNGDRHMSDGGFGESEFKELRDSILGAST